MSKRIRLLISRAIAAIFLSLGIPLPAAHASGPKHFILVHGGWHTGSSWNGVIEELRKRGFTAEAPTLPGYGAGNGNPSTTTLQDCADALLEVLRKQATPVILVAHSAGGVVVQQTVPLIADRVAEVVFLDAFLADDGKRFIDSLPPEIKVQYEKTAAANQNTLPVPDQLVRNLLMPGDTKAQQDNVISNLVTQPYGYYTGSVGATRFANTPLKRAFLFARDDKSLPPGAYKGMVAALGPFEEVDIPGGHEVMFTDPAAVAAGLAELATRLAK